MESYLLSIWQVAQTLVVVVMIGLLVKVHRQLALMRSARTGLPAMPMVCIVPKGNASFETSAAVTDSRMRREFGPMSDNTDHAEVTSSSWALASGLMLRRIQSKSWVAKPVPVTVTRVPPTMGPLEGDTAVMVGAGPAVACAVPKCVPVVISAAAATVAPRARRTPDWIFMVWPPTAPAQRRNGDCSQVVRTVCPT